MNTKTTDPIIWEIFNEIYYKIFGYDTAEFESKFIELEDLNVSQEEFQMYGITHNSLYKEIMR